MDKMRPGVVIIIATVGLLFTEGTRCSRSYNHFVKHRTKPREIRGFKPEYLSTAIGFGKRDTPFGLIKPRNHQNVLLALLQKTSQKLEKRRILCKQRNIHKIAMCD
ncbi:allatotropin-like [Athalia rosae]|uniref:allatotropin-like n=1 Tax=Athalia rosae TaxID=37344 RepID=UPI002033FB7C|nr:allatotropin-like [Athalia rosae]